LEGERREEQKLLTPREVRVEKPLGGCYMMRADVLQKSDITTRNLSVCRGGRDREKLARRGVTGFVPEARVSTTTG
jgi:hypothetical protein